MKTLKKLSAQTIMGKRITPPEKETLLFTIMGEVAGIQTGQTQFGDWTALIGNFVVIRADGEQFSGMKAFIAEPVHSMLAQRTLELEDGQTLEFCSRVRLLPRSDIAIGYEYVGDWVTQAEQGNPAQRLLEKFGGSVPSPTSQKPSRKRKSAA